LMNNTLDMKGALDYLVGVVKDDYLWDYADKIKPHKQLKQSTIDKYVSHIKAVQNYLRDFKDTKRYADLKFSHISSDSVCRQIATLLDETTDLKNNTKAGYLKSLDKVWKLYKGLPKKTTGQFSKLGLIPTEQKSDRKPVYKEEVFNCLPKYNTLNQLEALLFWLYSFCLVGMDGVDLVNLSEDLIAEKQDDKDLKVLDYFPLANTRYEGHLDKRLHIHRSRQKVKGSEVVTMCNLFPTLLIRDMLHHCIKLTRPHLAYTGRDKLRLFNFYTKNEDGSNNPNGMAKWKHLRDYYNSVNREKLGSTTQMTRKSITRIGRENNIPVDKLGSQIGHNVEGSIKHYLSDSQIELDIIQMQVFKDYDLIGILGNLIKLHKDKTLLDANGQEVNWIPNELLDIPMKKLFDTQKKRKATFVLNDRRITLETKVLSHFGYNKEWEYQQLLRREGKEYKVIEENGKMVQKEVAIDKNNWSDRLKELDKERHQELVQKKELTTWEKLKKKLDAVSSFEMHNISSVSTEKVS